jgi:hypothetical protein
MQSIVVLPLLISLVFCSALSFAEPNPPKSSNETHCVEFYNAFWINHHHFLYEQARAKQTPLLIEPDEAMTSQENQTLQSAIAYYKKHFVSHSLLFDPRLASIKQALSNARFNQPFKNNKLPTQWIDHLNASAPIYQKYYWSKHTKENTRWITSTQKLLKTNASTIQSRLETLFENDLCETPIRFDIVYANAHWAGAYTTSNPGHAVITSTKDGNKSLAALEMTFHEASHVQLLNKARKQVKQIEDAFKYQPQKGLLHAIHFYAIGEIVRQTLAEQGDKGYQPYAYKRGLYDGRWQRYEPLIVQHWQPLIDGKSTLKAALTKILAGLAKAQ